MDSHITGICPSRTIAYHRQPGTYVDDPSAIQKDAPESAATEGWAWGVNDQWEPKRSSDTSKPYHYWWLKRGTEETLAYDFDQAYTVSGVEVYWLDFDHYDGNFRVPASWKLYYKDGGSWKEVEAITPYTTTKDTYNCLDFKPVRTTGLKIAAQLQKGESGGVIGVESHSGH